MVSSLNGAPRAGPSKSATATTPSALAAQVATLESQLTGADFNPNPLIPLTALSRNASAEVSHKALWSLYRVWVRFIADGRVRYNGYRRKDVEGEEAVDEGKKVARWLADRFDEFLDTLQGALRDAELGLRVSGQRSILAYGADARVFQKSAILILLSLLPPLSASLSTLDPSQPPVLHVPYLRTLLRSLLTATVSLRGAQVKVSSAETQFERARKSNIRLEYQIAPMSELDADAASVLPADVAKEVATKLAAYDDIRWAFFHEIGRMLPELPRSSPHLAGNVLSLLLPLNNLPRLAEDINEFYCPHLAAEPSKTAPSTVTKTKKKKKLPGASGAVSSSGLDWLAEFDSSDESDAGGDAAESKKRKRALTKRGASGGMHSKIWSVDAHRRAFTDAWLSVLALPLSAAETRSILLVLHSTVFPNMMRGKVVLVADWLSSLCDGSHGGALALLSLNGLFALVRDYNLDYPNFYPRLYALMDGEVMHVKYRARFFRLSELFLSSTHLPAALVASFIKRLARLSLTAPPAAIIMLIPFVYNLLKRHPACMVMLQREDAAGSAEDTYDPRESDPKKTGALDSSLWELRALQRHYLSHVSTLAKIFSETFTKPAFAMEDFLDHGYGTLFETEVKRKLKNPPALSTEVDKAVVLLPVETGDQGEKEEAGEEQGDVVTKLFVF